MIFPGKILRRWLLAATLVGILGALIFARPLAWMGLRYALKRKFPDTPRISSAALAVWLRDANRRPPLLLDARTPEEFAVSHLPGARRVDVGGDVAAQLRDVPKDAPIVAYCSVGYRSSVFVEKMKRAGFTGARNLEGSLFQWANENRPLAEGQRAVHPFNFYWGLLLDGSRRAQLTGPRPE